MINKFKSIDNTIRKIVVDLGLGDREIPYTDFIEWIAEALRHIGAYTQFEQKVGEIEIENFKGKLPCDFVYVDEDKFFKPFKIHKDRIEVSFSKGILDLPYLAIPLDQEGLPMIPDDQSYDDALFWKVAMQLAIRGELKNKELSLQFCMQMWQRYCGQARGSANMLSLQALNRFANNFTRLNPLKSVYEKEFKEIDKSKGTLRRDGRAS
jgi:hypothetical protein